MKHYLLLIVALLGITLPALAQCPDNEIWYTTTDGKQIDQSKLHDVASHTYLGNSGVIRFNHKIEAISADKYSAGEHSIDFENCKNLKNITLPNSIKEIGYKAFAGCENLQSVILPNFVVKIGEEAFDGCSSLQSIVIPEGLEYIGNHAFRNCSAMESITIPDGVEYIRDGAFEGCSSLQQFKSKHATKDGLALVVNGTLASKA